MTTDSHCNALQRATTHRNTLQHTATYRHKWMSHVMRVSETCCIYECVVWRIWMCHVTHMNMSCRIYLHESLALCCSCVSHWPPEINETLEMSRVSFVLGTHFLSLFLSVSSVINNPTPPLFVYIVITLPHLRSFAVARALLRTLLMLTNKLSKGSVRWLNLLKISITWRRASKWDHTHCVATRSNTLQHTATRREGFRWEDTHTLGQSVNLTSFAFSHNAWFLF